MSLEQTLDQDLIAALKSGDTLKKETLRYLKSALKNAVIDSDHQQLSDEEVIAIIGREVKRRKESIEAFTRASRPELAENETKELAVLQHYLPAQLSEVEVTEIIEHYLKDHPTELSKLGQTMGALSHQLKGKADMALVSKILREKLQ